MKRYFQLFICTLFIVTSVYATVKDNNPQKPFVVVLDAGHGGKDPGKVSTGYNEKDIALAVVLKIGKILSKDKNIKVVYTRKTDVFIGLNERGKIANNADADLFVSVHCNAHNSNASGAETYVLGLHRNKTNFEVAKAENEVIFLEDDYETTYAGFDINSPESFVGITIMQEEFLEQSILLAKFIQDNLTNKLNRKNRGVKQAGFVVLHQTFMPSVLIETGFITNTSERNFLKSTKGQDDLANNIVDAIKQYKTILESNKGDFLNVKNTTVIQKQEEEEEKNSDTVFKIQIAASSRDLELLPQNFNGLDQVTKQKVGNVYRYFYGNTSSYSTAKELLANAKSKTYKDAYIIAYKNGERISVQEALK